MVLLVAGCGGGAAGGEALGGTFHSTSVTEHGSPRVLVDGTRVELSFTDDGRVLARAGCNHMQGPVSLKDGRIGAGELSMTAMGCPDPRLHEQDEWLSKFLGGSPSWRMDGANLVVADADTEIVLAPEVPVSLEGGKWVLDTLINGETAASVPRGVVATLAFQDGRVEVEAGCNSGSARYRTDGSSVTFEELVLTDMACGAQEDSVEKVVTEALQGRVQYEVDGQRLTLKGGSGVGAGFVKQG